MSLSKKSIYPFFETICVLEGKIQHPQAHELRYEKTYRAAFGKTPASSLLHQVVVPEKFKTGRVKLKVAYNENEQSVSFSAYPYRPIQTLQCVEAPGMDYSFKFSDRSKINLLFEQRGDCDDILITKKGVITDTSYANICLTDGEKWFTPERPLLEGTARHTLIRTKQLVEKEIHVNQLNDFRGFKLINAMRSFSEEIEFPIDQIIR